MWRKNCLEDVFHHLVINLLPLISSLQFPHLLFSFFLKLCSNFLLSYLIHSVIDFFYFFSCLIAYLIKFYPLIELFVFICDYRTLILDCIYLFHVSWTLLLNCVFSLRIYWTQLPNCVSLSETLRVFWKIFTNLFTVQFKLCHCVSLTSDSSHLVLWNEILKIYQEIQPYYIPNQ